MASRRAVAVVVRRDDGLVLAVQRPDEPGEELPLVWGLPATTLREDEADEEAIRRIGRGKLGVELQPGRVVGLGEQGRLDYTLRMTVYDASMTGEPRLPDRDGASGPTLYVALDWLPAESFREAADRGSLCCRVFLEAQAKTR
ncbi:MAG: NUDIX domain-containing protein [Dehalococcoidia bacterium]